MADKTDNFIGIVIVFLVGLVVAGALVPLGYSQLNSFSDASQCTNQSSGFWNDSTGLCTTDSYENVSQDYTSIPLSSLLVSGGIISIIMLIGVFSLIMAYAKKFDFSKGKR